MIRLCCRRARSKAPMSLRRKYTTSPSARKRSATLPNPRAYCPVSTMSKLTAVETEGGPSRTNSSVVIKQIQPVKTAGLECRKLLSRFSGFRLSSIRRCYGFSPFDGSLPDGATWTLRSALLLPARRAAK